MEAARERLFKEGRVTKLCPTEAELAAAPDDYQRLRLGCWLWKGYCQPSGHGHISFNKKLVKPHRLSYCLHHGKNLADISEVVIRHRCDVASCVNPEHLREGTQADNMRDMKKRGRAAKGTTNGNSKLKEEQVAAIRSDTRPQAVIAAEYRVSRPLISYIKQGKIWRSNSNIPT